MPTSFSFSSSERLLSFAVGLASAGRIFTAEQLAKHQELSWRSQPTLRAREFLCQHPQLFETIPGPYQEPMRRRLTTKAKRKFKQQWKSVSGISQKSHHWLGIGDIWMSLTFHGGRPTKWQTEPDGQFDIYCEWQNRCLLIEYQRTPITQYQWKQKWKRRVAWYREQEWNGRPLVVLVDVTGQQDETVSLPKGVLHVKSIDELPKKIMRPPH